MIERENKKSEKRKNLSVRKEELWRLVGGESWKSLRKVTRRFKDGLKSKNWRYKELI